MSMLLYTRHTYLKHLKWSLFFFTLFVIIVVIIELSIFFSPSQNKIIVVEQSLSKFLTIPKIIHCTGRDSQRNTKAVESWSKLNKDWQFIWYSDDDVKHLILNETSYLIPVWNQLKGVRKYDLFRYVALYKFGGLYVDSDVTCKVPISKWSSLSGIDWDKHLFISGMECNGCNDIGLQAVQYAFLSIPRHPILKHIITQISANAFKSPAFFKRFGRLNKVIHMTGPGVFSDAIIGYIIANGYEPNDITPHGTAGDVLILEWWFWLGFAQGDDVPKERPSHISEKDQFISHAFRGSWVGRD